MGSARYVLFIDFGHSKVSLTTFALTKEKIAVVQQHHDRNLGCRNMDYLVLEYYREIFRKGSGGLDIMDNKKAFVKLMEVVEKQRRILSANTEYTLNLDCLMEEEDFSFNMTREHFEKLIEPVLSRLGNILQKHKTAIEGLNLKLHNIELMGGGTRIPAVIRLVQSVFKVDPARTINSSEAVAKGCALMSAFKNPQFRPCDFIIEEMNYHQIAAVWEAGK